jgi:hypothetical protein
MVQDLANARDASRQVADVLDGIAFQDALETNSVRNPANHQRRDLKAQLSAEAAVNCLLESMRRITRPGRIHLSGRRDRSARQAHPDGATVSHPIPFSLMLSSQALPPLKRSRIESLNRAHSNREALKTKSRATKGVNRRCAACTVQSVQIHDPPNGRRRHQTRFGMQDRGNQARGQ